MPANLLVPIALALALTTGAQAAITISTHKTTDENCSAGICTPTGPNPNIRVKDLQKLLVHSDMKIVTGQGSTGIDVVNPLTWASKHRLTLDANQSIHIAAPVVVEGKGGVTLITNDGATGGDYAFDAPGSLTFWDLTSSLVINGQSFTLVKDIATLAGNIAANASGNYALADNYDASADGTYANAPVQTTFHGTFEGLGATIQNLTIASAQQSQNLGLFAILYSEGTIRDINLSNAAVSGIGTVCCLDENAGTLVANNFGTVTRVTASGSVSEGSGRTKVGGLAGASVGTISHSSFSGNLFSGGKGSSVGGISGGLLGTILQSMATVNIGGGSDVGGLVGALDESGTIMLSQAHGTVRGLVAGGLVGAGDSQGDTIAQSFASTDVTGRSAAGGLIGDLWGTKITQSYATGSVKAKRNAGGIVGDELGVAASEVYATGLVRGSSAGGLGGYCQGATLSAAYWDITTTKQDADHCGATGLTDAQLKSGLPAGFDPNVWGQNPGINNGWPYLLANPPQ